MSRLATAQENLQALALIPGMGPTEQSAELAERVAGIREEFLNAMRDDFNTALAISHMFALGREINTYYQSVVSGQERADGRLVNIIKKGLAEMCSIIGVLENTCASASPSESLEGSLLDLIVSMRQEARQNKNYAQADAIRDKLWEIGIIIEDTPQGARWKKQ